MQLNPRLDSLQPYPFEKLRALFTGPAHFVQTEAMHSYSAIRMEIGEPQHSTPKFIQDALITNLDGLAKYPVTLGSEALRLAIAQWLAIRHNIPQPDIDKQILPVCGSREALFAFAQCVINPANSGALVLCPNPFYQIYEGAALLAGATPVFLNQLPENQFAFSIDSLEQNLPRKDWSNIQLIYVCSPNNPTGTVLDLDAWRSLFAFADSTGAIIASDECYSEIYFDEAAKPLGALDAAYRLGRKNFEHLVVFSSLSKRSNVPGLRSGFVAGDAKVLAAFFRYRTYHGCAMSPAVQAASTVAWCDEEHVQENRRLYREKFLLVVPLLQPWLKFSMPPASFYLWAQVPDHFASELNFAKRLYHQYNVSVLPGSYLARSVHGVNPGAKFIRIALVDKVENCIAAANRIVALCAVR